MTKVLIVEDDALLSKMYASIFLSEQYEVETALDGQDGLEKARASKPTIILLDIMMPKLNGMEALRKLKAEPELKDIPVIVLTNLAGDIDIHTALDLGAVRYIIKSENKPKDVVVAVREVLGSQPHDASSAANPAAPANPAAS